eukprot:4035444-Prymnesium_polylepis.4
MEGVGAETGLALAECTSLGRTNGNEGRDFREFGCTFGVHARDESWVETRVPRLGWGRPDRS